ADGRASGARERLRVGQGPLGERRAVEPDQHIGDHGPPHSSGIIGASLYKGRNSLQCVRSALCQGNLAPEVSEGSRRVTEFAPRVIAAASLPPVSPPHRSRQPSSANMAQEVTMEARGGTRPTGGRRHTSGIDLVLAYGAYAVVLALSFLGFVFWH